MKYRKMFYFFLITLVFILFVGCDKNESHNSQQESELEDFTVTEYSQEKLEWKDIEVREYGKLRGLDESGKIVVIGLKGEELALVEYFNDKTHTQRFINYNIKDHNFKELIDIKTPTYADYMYKYDDKFIMIYEDRGFLNIYTVNDQGMENNKELGYIKTFSTYAMKDYVAINYDKIIDSKLVDTLAVINKKDLEVKIIAETEANFIDDSREKVSGNLIGNISSIENRLFYQVYSVEDATLSNIDFIKTISSYEFNLDNDDFKEIDFKERANSFFVTENLLVYNLYIKDRPSEQGSFLKYKGDEPIPLSLGDSANYFFDIKEKGNFEFINSPRAIYCIDENSSSIKYLEKPKESIQYILSDDKEYDLIELDSNNNLKLYKFN